VKNIEDVVNLPGFVICAVSGRMPSAVELLSEFSVLARFLAGYLETDADWMYQLMALKWLCTSA
jgi:hypothetical protein